jgi:hypothetical protein
MSLRRLIHKKKINRITQACFSYNDVVIAQDGEMVILDKAEILELAQLIKNEIMDKEFYEKGRELRNGGKNNRIEN